MGRLRNEDGAALLIALAFLVFFGLVIAAVLGFAEASVRVTGHLREQRDTVYAADGAMDGAIQLARMDPSVGAFGKPASCSAPCVPCITYSVILNGKTANVTCVSIADPVDLQRRVVFTASVDGVPRVTAEVAFDDLAPPPAPVDIESWTYLR
jgi:Tfp pilus assembly protein PilX